MLHSAFSAAQPCAPRHHWRRYPIEMCITGLSHFISIGVFGSKAQCLIGPEAGAVSQLGWMTRSSLVLATPTLRCQLSRERSTTSDGFCQ